MEPAVDLTPDLPTATVAVIGGSGFYEWFDSTLATHQTVELATPYGVPSGPITVAQVGGRSVAFLPRHGPRHEYPPHAINYRANVWALRRLGVQQVLAPCAVGSLQPARVPRGSLVVPDQLVDRTSGRPQTFSTLGATHVPFADPYCPRLSRALIQSGADRQATVIDGGTMVVIEGPRFSTRAESIWYAAQGWDLVNMTGHPEAVLARELQMCYAALAFVTDLDAGTHVGEGVSESEVYELFTQSLPLIGAILAGTINALPASEGCTCATWADDLELAYAVPSR